MIHYLINHGADIHLKNNEKMSPLNIAEAMEDKNTLDALTGVMPFATLNKLHLYQKKNEESGSNYCHDIDEYLYPCISSIYSEFSLSESNAKAEKRIYKEEIKRREEIESQNKNSASLLASDAANLGIILSMVLI